MQYIKLISKGNPLFHISMLCMKIVFSTLKMKRLHEKTPQFEKKKVFYFWLAFRETYHRKDIRNTKKEQSWFQKRYNK